ncbi:MAG: cytochrome c-type biogenesis protein CcmH [Gaiellales bacterium]
MIRPLRLLLVALALCAVIVPASAVAASNWSYTGIQTELMCPTCQGERLDISTAPAANRVRAYLRRAHAEGLSESQVKTALVAQFGQQVLAAPPRSGFGLVAWLAPIAAVLAGLVLAVWLARRWLRSRSTGSEAVAGGESDPVRRAALEAQLDDELARFE